MSLKSSSLSFPSRVARNYSLLFVLLSDTISPTILTLWVLNLFSQVQCEMKKHKRVHIRLVGWKIDLNKKMPKINCIAIFQSRHLNIFEKFRKPVTCAKGHLSVITKVSRFENLGKRGEGHELSTLLARSKIGFY